MMSMALIDSGMIARVIGIGACRLAWIERVCYFVYVVCSVLEL